MQNKTNRRSVFPLMEIMIVVATIGLLAAIAVPSFVKSRETSQLNYILNNLSFIERAKNQWQVDQKKKVGDTPTAADLALYMNKGAFPPTAAVVGETYNINAVGTIATAKTPVKLSTYAAGSYINLPFHVGLH